MATITKANAEQLINAFNNCIDFTQVTGTRGLEISLMHHSYGEIVVVINISGMSFQGWNLSNVVIRGNELIFFGDGSPIRIKIRG